MRNFIVIPKLNTAYLPIPKNACSTIKHLLYLLSNNTKYINQQEANGKVIYIHDYYSQRTKELEEPNNYFKFTIVREPIKRLLSAYSNRVLYHKELSQQQLEKRSIQMENIPDNPEINTFINYLEQYRKVPDIEHHTALQSEFLFHSLDGLDRIYKVEELEQVFRPEIQKLVKQEVILKKYQTGGKKIKLEELNEDSFNKLLEYTKKDYELLKDYYSSENIIQEYQQCLDSVKV